MNQEYSELKLLNLIWDRLSKDEELKLLVKMDSLKMMIWNSLSLIQDGLSKYGELKLLI